MPLKNKLLQLTGSTIMYKTENHKIIAIKQTDESVFISTDKDLLIFPLDDIEEIIEKEFLPVEVDNDGLTKSNGLVVFQQVKATDLVKVLQDNISRLQKEPGYIKQATAINQTTNTLLNLVKTELSARKMGTK